MGAASISPPGRFESRRLRSRPEPLSIGAVAICGVLLAALLATSTRYGPHRDEMYFIVAGGHLGFGYPDQPPLVPLIAWAMNALAPGSLLLLRAPAALASSAAALLSALIAREAGGGARAQTIAAACTTVSAFALAVGHMLTTTTPDILSTTALGWLMIRAILRERPGCLLAAGVVAGLGFEAKPQVAFVAVVMALCWRGSGPVGPCVRVQPGPGQASPSLWPHRT